MNPAARRAALDTPFAQVAKNLGTINIGQLRVSK
jgi:hypothetical protein